jgi:hypothetical protein
MAMTHRELLSKIVPVLRKHDPKGAAWLLNEVDRWTEGDFEGEADPDYPCCFCERPASPTRLLLGCSAEIGADGKILKPKFHMVIPPGWMGEEESSPPFPVMVCDDCVRAYEALMGEDTMTGRRRPSPNEVLSQTISAILADGSPDADALAAEVQRRFHLSHPREVKRAACTLCKRDQERVVIGDIAQICGTCLETAREKLRSAFKDK